jgi:hypothetical protein
VKALVIGPGSPWENGFSQLFTSIYRDELLTLEIFYPPEKAQILIERWRDGYNAIRSHSSMQCEAPAPRAVPVKQKESIQEYRARLILISK